MGRNMFGPDRGELDLGWTGWWGPEPPYGVPAFVLTHHVREPLVMGATTFDFVTDGIETALEQRKLPPVSARSRWRAGRAPSTSASRPVWSTSGICTSRQLCSAGRGSASSREYRGPSWNRCR
jgi:hypothetical protein